MMPDIYQTCISRQFSRNISCPLEQTLSSLHLFVWTSKIKSTKETMFFFFAEHHEVLPIVIFQNWSCFIPKMFERSPASCFHGRFRRFETEKSAVTSAVWKRWAPNLLISGTHTCFLLTPCVMGGNWWKQKCAICWSCLHNICHSQNLHNHSFVVYIVNANFLYRPICQWKLVPRLTFPHILKHSKVLWQIETSQHQSWVALEFNAVVFK